MTRDEFFLKFNDLFAEFFDSHIGLEWVHGYRKVLYPSLNIDYEKLYSFLLTDWTKLKTPPEPSWFKRYFSLCSLRVEEQEKISTDGPIPALYFEAKEKLKQVVDKQTKKFKVKE